MQYRVGFSGVNLKNSLKFVINVFFLTKTAQGHQTVSFSSINN